ncbi:hypothetical protein EVAR_93403_1 [Eumeta japonica]|uniref:Uncharacterized protein n=1 Tax=Eumeta variegata TaxID=151549 RepID=A0A4C1UR51_EUMVA|nr:hypothetical protein EVAR_93403_1 [Eumeta japonica]
MGTTVKLNLAPAADENHTGLGSPAQARELCCFNTYTLSNRKRIYDQQFSIYHINTLSYGVSKAKSFTCEYINEHVYKTDSVNLYKGSGTFGGTGGDELEDLEGGAVVVVVEVVEMVVVVIGGEGACVVEVVVEEKVLEFVEFVDVSLSMEAVEELLLVVEFRASFAVIDGGVKVVVKELGCVASALLAPSK